ncbi:sensor histidine kinase [Aliikangiella sp. IMCC44359]|uniref:sensor histidine kinase n=1 Tax=Aliikangiella sp. IMCC44359 TaxID=3459125 RepID=UPI00403AC0F5
MLSIMPCILSTLFLGELTVMPKKHNPMASMLSIISRDAKKLFIVCFIISIITILMSMKTALPLDQRDYQFGNRYALAYMAAFGIVWVAMLVSGLRPVEKGRQFIKPAFRYVMAIVLLLILSVYLIDYGRAGGIISITSTVALSLCFCWYRFRTQFMDVILRQFLRILMVITIVFVLSQLIFWMNLRQLDINSQMLLLFAFVITFGLLFSWFDRKLNSLWHPPITSLSLIHSELPAILTQSTEIDQSIKKVESYLSHLFSTQVSINRPMPHAVHTLKLKSEPKIEVHLGYLRRWMPWFSEALNWVRTAALYLQGHIKVLQTLEYEHQQKLKTEALAGLAAKAELIAMRSQIRPHFLFNILNSIHNFVTTDPKKAEHTIELLAELMRGVLQISDKDEVSLAQELDLVEKYLSIEKIRYGEQFQYEMDIDEQCLVESIPSFSIQPLVENAIKHAVDNQIEPVNIKIVAFKASNLLKIKVIDDGPGLLNHSSKGLGMALQNIENRLKILYGADGQFTLLNASERGAIAMFQVPLVST